MRITILFILPILTFSYKSPHFTPNKSTIVHLFEWKWSDIARECEDFLQHKGYGGVQISPPNENLIINNRPWWERYQPVSYLLITRSGNENSFRDMTKRCNKVGVRIYADTIINHMSAGNGAGTAGNVANATHRYFPGVPYGPNDFNPNCGITNYDDKENVRNCELVALKDLNQGKEHVRSKITQFMNHLIDLGVAGFRIDAARHMWPSDLENIYCRLKNLNTTYGFPENARPFIYQEVTSMDRDYVRLGTLVEFNYGKSLSNVFKGNDKLKWLINWGSPWGLIDGLDAVTIIDNHDTQRESSGHILNYKQPKQYKMAIAFMLAHPYGTPKIMSSFAFENKDKGPPCDNYENIISPKFESNCCGNGWDVSGTSVDNWWSNGDQQIAFCRGKKGFIVFTNWGDVQQEFQTCLPAGIYCDVISGGVMGKNCSGKSVSVRNDGKSFIKLGALEFNGMLAIHVKSRVG